jgi:hypothetical protein
MNDLAASREVSTANRQTADLQSALRRKRRGIEPVEIDNVRARQILQELADLPATDDANQSVADGLVDRNGHALVHDRTSELRIFASCALLGAGDKPIVEAP